MNTGDWVSPWFEAACLPDRWDVAGIEVDALTIWHTFALERGGNRFIVGGDPPDRDDAASLLIVAERNHAAGRRLMLDDRYRGKAQSRMHNRIKGIEWMPLLSACYDYTGACLRTLDRFAGDGSPAAVPYQFHILRVICAEWGYTMPAAWDVPYSLARHYYDASAEAAGDKKLMSEDVQHITDTWPAEAQEEAS